MFGIFDKKMVDVDTRGENGTLVIGMSFIFIAYFLHPAVESAYHRVRAYRAWRALQKRQAVEVTDYPMLVETLRGRGTWDTARIVTVLLAVFSLVSWGLELSMGLAYHEGKASLFNRSPSVTVKTLDSGNVWEVKPGESFDYDGNLKNDLNVYENRALSMYDVKEPDTCNRGRVKGSINAALWSEDPNDEDFVDLYYSQTATANVTVKNLQCANGENNRTGIRLLGSEDNWGTVVTCENGPKQINVAPAGNDTDAPPMLILNRSSDPRVFLIVEESSNYPSFMYSVWTNGTEHNDSVELAHVFRIASTVRLAEAVVTTIVQDKPTGFDCFRLVRVNSDKQDKGDREDESGSIRAKPFGEDPTNALVKIENLETIECGLQIDLKALICLVSLTLLTTVGITWSFCLRSSIGMDAYDRDELIRAVSMSVVAKSSSAPSAMRIFVRKEDNGNLSVVISDACDAETGCAQFFRRRGPVVEDAEPAPNAAIVDQLNNGSSGASIPAGARTTWLEGVRIGTGRPTLCRERHCRTISVALTASPVPSPACSQGGTPVHSRSPLSRVPRVGPGFTGGRGASVLFEGSFSSSASGEDEPDGMQAGRRGEIERGGATGARIVAPGDQRGAVPEGMTPPDIEGQRVLDSLVMVPTLVRFQSSRATGGSSPLPPLMRDFTLGPPQLGPLAQGWGDETTE